MEAGKPPRTAWLSLHYKTALLFATTEPGDKTTLPAKTQIFGKYRPRRGLLVISLAGGEEVGEDNWTLH